MQTRTDLPPAEGSRAELHDRLNQRLEALSPPLLQIVLDFVEFLLGQQQRIGAVLGGASHFRENRLRVNLKA